VLVFGGSEGGLSPILLQQASSLAAHGHPTLALAYSAWTLRGRELPYVGYSKFGAPAASVDPRALIPVERIRAPVVLTCGDLDLLWPSCDFVDDVTGRLAAKHFAHPVTALRYPDAGHYAGSVSPYTPVTDEALEGAGGSVQGSQRASVEVHRRLRALLAAR
jgi:hypothetical protein